MAKWFVLVTGPPASGKSTVAPALARALDAPLVSKDVIKDALVEVVPPAEVEQSRVLGRAAVRAMFSVAQCCDRAVLESVLRRGEAEEQVLALNAAVVEVFCRAPQDVCRLRFAARAQTPRAGYFDAVRTDAELWHPDICDPLSGGWPVVEVDTCVPLDVEALAASVLAAIGGG